MGSKLGKHTVANMNEPSQDESEKKDPANWKKFVVILTGRTNGAHKPVVKKLKSKGHKEVKAPEDADYCLVFCPVSSRVGTDVSDAMERLPDGKKAVLVVMHHTFNRKQVIPRSGRLVDEDRVQLTLDCLFHQNKLLNCEFNDKNMMSILMKFFRLKRSPNPASLLSQRVALMKFTTKNPNNEQSAKTQK